MVEAEVQRVEGEGALFLVMPIMGVPCALVMDSIGGGVPITGLALLDGMAPKNPNYPARAHRGRLLAKNERCTITCRVERNHVLVAINDTAVFEWTGDVKRLSLTPFYASDFPTHLLVGSERSQFRIESLALRPLSASAAQTEYELASSEKARPLVDPGAGGEQERTETEAPAFSVAGWLTIATPAGGYQWSEVNRQEIAGTQVLVLACKKEGSTSVVVLTAEGVERKGNQERTAAVKEHVNSTIDGLQENGFQNLKADGLSLPSPVPDFVENQLTGKRPDGSPLFIRVATAFKKNTYLVQVIAETEQEAASLSRVISTLREPSL